MNAMILVAERILLRSAIILILLMYSPLTIHATTYTNCNFKNKNYEAVCKAAVAKGVSHQYANTFLLSPRMQMRDAKSFALFSPQKITMHHANEKRANNALVPYVPQIVAHLQKHKAVYDKAEREYGVDREVIAAILMKETRLGTFVPKHEAVTVFNTLLTQLKSDTARNKRLLTMAKTNMTSLIAYCFKNDIAPKACRFKSSYAGAVGIPQFMPQNFGYIRAHHMSLGDLNRMEDAIVSVAAFLKFSAGYRGLIDWSKIPDMKKLESQWYDYDAAHKNASFVYAKGTHKRYHCFTCKDDSLQYVRRYVRYIMSYNNASNYAVGVMRLAYDAHVEIALR